MKFLYNHCFNFFIGNNYRISIWKTTHFDLIILIDNRRKVWGRMDILLELSYSWPYTKISRLQFKTTRKNKDDNFQKLSKNQPCDIIKMRNMRERMGKETPKKRWIIPHCYDVTWLIFETLCKVTQGRPWLMENLKTWNLYFTKPRTFLL